VRTVFAMSAVSGKHGSGILHPRQSPVNPYRDRLWDSQGEIAPPRVLPGLSSP
jgi:hypothetical protein